jgi:glycosyltransferase involved in cell wall biosynthesis
MSPSKPVLYIDCTSTYITGLNTGIQRVVRNIVSRARMFEQKYNYTSCPVVIIDGEFYKFEFNSEATSGKGKTAVPNQVKSWLEKWKNQASNIPLVGYFLKLFFIALVFAGRIVYKVLKRFRLKKLKKTHDKVLRFDQNSAVVFLDAFWDKNSVSGFKKAKDEAGSMISVMYDIIPVTHPQFLETVMTDLFISALKRVSLYSDGFLSISNSVRKSLITYFQEENLHRAEHVHDYFHLGSDFKGGSLESDNIRENIKSIFSSEDVWLVVGTIEPRKNHVTVIKAFEDYISSGADSKLIILGWVGWKADKILSEIIRSPLYGNKIFMFNNASDSELEYCYSKCQGLIFASFTEGFGLPLVEAMQRNLKVLVSDIPVFKEIGGDYPEYFDPSKAESLSYALKNSVKKSDKDKHSSVLISWDESAEQFFKKAVLLHQQIISKKSF